MAYIRPTPDATEDELKHLRDAVHALPPQPVEDLLSNGACPRCILRIFGLHDQICSWPSVSTPVLSTLLNELSDNYTNGEKISSSDPETIRGSEEDINFCVICLGILQFLHLDKSGKLTRKSSAIDFAAAIADVVKMEGHQIDNFNLEVSIPPTVIENEKAVWLYIEKKFSSEPWFTQKFQFECTATKDFLKLSLSSLLETLLDAKARLSDFRIRLTYTLPDESAKSQHLSERNGCIKRRKTGDGDFQKKCAGVLEVEGQKVSENSSNNLEDRGFGFLKFPVEMINRCCSLVFQGYRTPTFIGGRYIKYSRNVSQSRWIIDDERRGEASVEEIVGCNILPICHGDSYKFHAAGREDMDVRMLGTGRPFLVEIQNARQFPSDILVKDMENKINSLESKLVRVKNLKVFGSQGWELMREGEAEKQKQYAALVWISRPLTCDDDLTLSSRKDTPIQQRTPVRVLHRRSPLEREKVIHWMKMERIAGHSQYFLLHLCTQAGTYIKEFVHGDLGRTHPSVGSMLGCRAEILRLDVTDVKMDCFQL
ncbi:uncharacterized protein [Primulina eburnea]|uniref:uncharacterized protein n=1 Tax=Primulina eburnea TaxID=1245227 RepID=UPI003C6C1770